MFAAFFHHADTENYVNVQRSIDSHLTIQGGGNVRGNMSKGRNVLRPSSLAICHRPVQAMPRAVRQNSCCPARVVTKSLFITNGRKNSNRNMTGSGVLGFKKQVGQTVPIFRRTQQISDRVLNILLLPLIFFPKCRFFSVPTILRQPKLRGRDSKPPLPTTLLMTSVKDSHVT